MGSSLAKFPKSRELVPVAPPEETTKHPFILPSPKTVQGTANYRFYRINPIVLYLERKKERRGEEAERRTALFLSSKAASSNSGLWFHSDSIALFLN